MIPRSTPGGGSRLPQIALVTILLSAGVVLGGASLGDQAEGRERGLQPEAPEQTATAPQDGDLKLDRTPVQLEVVAPIPATDPLDPLAALQDHWGAQWPQIKSEVFGNDLEAELQATILPWEDSAELHLSSYRLDERHQDTFYRRLMKWPGWEFSDQVLVPDANNTELTAQKLASYAGDPTLQALSTQTVEQIDLDLFDVNEHLDGRIREYMDLLDRAIELEFNAGGLVRAPLKMQAFDPKPDAIFGRTVRGNGWHSRLEVSGERYPYLADLDREIRDLRQARKVSLVKLVAVHATGG